MFSHHESYWHKTVRREPRPAFEGEADCEVAVIGGGLTGVTTALLLARQGVPGVLLEADRLGSGTSGSTTAKITLQHGLKYSRLLSSMGREKTLEYALANRLGMELIGRLAEELAPRCGYEITSAHVYTRDPLAARIFDEEARALDTLGLPFRTPETCGLPFSTERILTMDGQAQFHPLKYLHGLADAIPADRFPIYEQTRVLEVIPGSPCELRTDGGRLTARSVVMATRYPLRDMPGLYFARLHQERSYLMSVDAGDYPLGGMYISEDAPVRSARMHRDEDGTRLLVGGFGHPAGRGGAPDTGYDALYAFFRKAFEGVEAQPDSAWSAEDCMPADHVPMIGPMSDEASNLYVATGYAKWGMSASAAAALLLTAMITGQRHEILETRRLFAPSRFTPGASAREFAVQGARVAGSFAGGMLAADAGQPGEMSPGEGEVAREAGELLALSRDSGGRLRACGAHCTHMGCPVVWNDQEETWDCPCHGSRFHPDGRVLEGPAVRPLPPERETEAVPDP